MKLIAVERFMAGMSVGTNGKWKTAIHCKTGKTPSTNCYITRTMKPVYHNVRLPT